MATKNEIKGLLFSSDVEMGVTIEPSKVSRSSPRNSLDPISMLVPPVYFTKFAGSEILGYKTGEDPEDKTHPILARNEEYEIFQDGALFETDLSPGKSPEKLYKSFLGAQEVLEDFITKTGVPHLSEKAWTSPVGRFSFTRSFPGITGERRDEIKGEEVRQACIAGCSPDNDAIDKAYVSKERDLSTWKFRGLGGHLHISISPEYGDVLHRHCLPFGKLLAITVGNVYNSFLEEFRDMEKHRRAYFGHPGRFRVPVYPDGRLGFEYRALSPIWLTKLERTEGIVEALKLALRLFLNDIPEAKRIISHHLPDTVEAIYQINSDQSLSILEAIGYFQ